MEIYTLKEASRKAKIGMETLKRVCEEGLLKASRLANGQWRVADYPFLWLVSKLPQLL